MTAQSALPGSSLGGYPSLSALGRDEAVAALFRLHHRRLVGLARLLVVDFASAEDVVQDAFVALYKRWRWLQDKDAAVGYLDQAVLNTARSLLRKRRVRSACTWPRNRRPRAARRARSWPTTRHAGWWRRWRTCPTGSAR